jgi:hypothetical protein
MTTNYYQLPEVSNSDLSWLKDLLYPRETVTDPREAYAFGSLIDAMLTEPGRVDYFKRSLDGKPFRKELFDNAVKMKQAFRKDEFCASLIEKSDGQKVSIVHDRQYSYRGFPFALDVRCKWDIWRPDWGWGGDIKSTVASTQKEFEAAALYFDYDRQRAFYMDLQDCERDVLIGISKVNHRIFKIFINRKSEFYKRGKDKYTELAFRWHLLFGKNKKNEQ